ncbi:MAG TPA: hypothetical protein VGC42_01125 [Kofleriaceae bacterium]
MVRLHTVVLILTTLAACGTGSSMPKPEPATAIDPPPPSSPPIKMAQFAPPDAGVPDAPPAPTLACEAGLEPRLARAPDPTMFCARPDGVRHGPFLVPFPDGTPEITGSYKDGVLDGPWQRRAGSGAIVESGQYAAGQKTGHWTQSNLAGAELGAYDLKAGTGTEKRWLEDGSLYRERKLKAGVPHGPETVYGADHTPVLTAKWFLGKLDGPHAVGSKASLRIEETYAGGTRRGARQIWQFWSPLVDENYDHSGRHDGEYTIWRSKKLARVKGSYDHGKRDGLWTWSDRDSNKEREGNYVDGKKDGPWTEWYDNKIVFTGSYARGKPDGEFIYYDRNQNELGRFTITGGTGTMQTFWPNKKVASKQHVFAGANDGVYQELTTRSKVVVEGHYRSDAKHGAWKEWTADGVPTLEQGWKRNRLDGVVKKLADGKLLSEATYKDGKAIGKYVEYRDGKPALTGQFTDDKRSGVWTRYDAGGHVLSTASYKDGVLDGAWKQLVDGAVLEGTMSQGRRTGTWKRTDKAGAVSELHYPTSPASPAAGP